MLKGLLFGQPVLRRRPVRSSEATPRITHERLVGTAIALICYPYFWINYTYFWINYTYFWIKYCFLLV